VKILIAICATALVLLPTATWTEEGDPLIMVQAWSFSDSDLTTTKGESCSSFLAYLLGPSEKYKMLDVTGVAGPPGVVYTLQNNNGEIAVMKCGTAGGHDTGGGCGEEAAGTND